MSSTIETAVIGAGPYGLSIASHLSALALPLRVFGIPMASWQSMPSGMKLKSDGFASDIYDPRGNFTLKSFCQQNFKPYQDYGSPVNLETFVEYGMAFQRRLVPQLECQKILAVSRHSNFFELVLENNDRVRVRNVIVATGITGFDFTPAVLQRLPPELWSHSSTRTEPHHFAGRRVVIVGGGSSALDLAALLNQHGAKVTLISRQPLRFHAPPDDKTSFWRKLRSPNLGLGPGLRSALYTLWPGMFSALPEGVRLQIVRKHLGPSGGWFVKDSVINGPQLLCGYDLEHSETVNGEVRVRCRSRDNDPAEVRADYLIAATGYRVALSRLKFFSAELLQNIRLGLDGSPILSRHFESSVPGLYFTGLAAAATFGPVQRFALGAKYASSILASKLLRNHRYTSSTNPQAAVRTDAA